MKLSLRASNAIFYALTASVIVVSIVCFAGAVSWVNKPFAGFLTYEVPRVGPYSSKEWPGRSAGLKFLDRVVSVDGQAVTKGSDIIEAVREKEPGTQVEYLIEARGEIQKVRIPVTVFGIKDFLLIFFTTFIGGLIFYALGFVVYFLKPNALSSWIFLLASFGQAIYMMTGFEIQSTYLLVQLHYFILGLFPAFFFHLGLIFPERKQVLVRAPALEYVVYVPGLVLALVFLVFFSSTPETRASDFLSWMPSYTQLGSSARVFMLFCFLSLIAFVLHSYFKASIAQVRQRAMMILFGVSIASMPSVSLMAISYFLKAEFPWNFLTFFLVFFPASIAYSIIRHNLFDADEIIKRTVGYFVVTAVVIGAYAVVSVGFNFLLGQYRVAESKAFPILFTLGIILIFNPLRNRIQRLVDSLFFRREYDYGAIVDRVSSAIASLLELPQILRQLTQTFIEDMFINTGSVMLLSPSGAAYSVYIADGDKKEELQKISFNRDKPLVRILEKKKSELTKYDLLEDPEYKSVCEACSADFDALNASLMIPIVYQNQVIGIFSLGDKKSGKSYKREDIDLLRTLAHQGAVAIENAKLFQENLEKQRMEEELAIARDLQISMLPAASPEIRGLKIAASSAPAREVGGDFYDFIEMGERRVGLVVGDVTGKSVSGALVMSSSRSVFRMLSEEKLTVGEIMTRANRRIKKDIKTGMFVALLYAVLDAEEGIVRLCSAGQTQPVYYSSKSGQAKLVETIGDNFPLGIMDEADYLETRIEVASGDKIVFYTDGIVEAMNEKREILGFDRLLDLVRREHALSAESLLKKILEEVNAFAAGAPQHDDLTLIIVGVETSTS